MGRDTININIMAVKDHVDDGCDCAAKSHR
jgi:hypothetical protein